MKKTGKTLYPVTIFKPANSSKLHYLPTKEDQTRQLHATIDQLKRDMARQNDRMRRLVEEIEDEILIWTRLLESRQGESYDAVKRRISRLKGSLEYPGIPGFEMKER